MLTESGRVVAVEEDGVWVQTVRSSTCGSCAARKGCGQGVLNRMGDGRHGYVRALPGKLSPAECAVDDQVLISIPEEVILRGSLVVYLWPLVAMLAAAGAMPLLLPGSPDLAAAVGALGGLVLGFLAVRWHGERHRDDPSFQPVLLAKEAPDSQALTLH